MCLGSYTTFPFQNGMHYYSAFVNRAQQGGLLPIKSVVTTAITGQSLTSSFQLLTMLNLSH